MVSAAETGLLLIYSVLSLATLVGIARTLRLSPILERVWSALHAASGAGGTFAEGDADELGPLVRVKMQHMKVGHVRWMCQGLCVSMFPFLVIMVLNILIGRPRVLSLPQDLVIVLLYSVLVVVLICPSAVSSRTIDPIYGFITLCGTLFISPWFCKPEQVLLSLLYVNLPVILLNMARRPELKLGSMNLLLAISASSTIVASASVIKMRPLSLIFLQFAWSCPLPLLLISLIEVGIGSAIRQGLEMQATEELLAAAVALLRSFCEVVIELDQEGAVANSAQAPALQKVLRVQKAKDLAGFLLMDPSRTLQGLKLTDFMSNEEDKAAFLRHLREQEPGGMGLAEAIHVRLRDTDRNVLRFELLTFKFRRFNGQPRYMVGLREFDDVTAGGGRLSRRVQQLDPAARFTHMVEPRREGAEDGEEEEAANSAPSRTDSCSTDICDVDLEAAQMATLIVDCTNPGLPVQGHSLAFRLCVGRVHPGTHLVDLVDGRDRDAFVEWAQLVANANVYGERFPDYRVTLNISQVRLKATCRLWPDAGGMYDLQRTRLLFFDISRGRHSRGLAVTSGLKCAPADHLSM